MSTNAPRGRARGKPGRGRSQATPTDAAQAQERRPGEIAQTSQARGRSVSAHHQQQQQLQQELPPAAVRVSYRGRGEPSAGAPPPQSVPVSQMGSLSIGAGDPHAGRERRGRREDATMMDLIHTRPAHITDKQGSKGSAIDVVANYLKLECHSDWRLYQYHVSYNPEVEHRKTRLAMLFSNEELLGKTRAFDGMVLYLAKKLPLRETEVCVTHNATGEIIRITITLTNELPATSPQCLHIYNVMFRRILGHLNMQQIGRNYYDAVNTIKVHQHHLEIMPGFCTSILDYDGGVMLCADISHKILRSDTILDMMYDMHERVRNFHDECIRKFVGQIVITRYNNKTYRVDDIAWDKKVTDTFMRGTEEVTYLKYFKDVYSETIQDENQPMLMSMPKAKEKKMGKTDPIYLPPSLCVLTGLSDEVRSNFSVMKDLGAHTRAAPSVRCDTLQNFIKQIYTNPQAKTELDGWQVHFSEELLTIKGRVLPQERVFQKGIELSYRANEADWSRDMRGKKMNTPVNLSNWLIVCGSRNKQQAYQLSETLQKVGFPMGFMISSPTVVELQNEYNDTYLAGIRSKVTPETQLVLTLLSTNRKDGYDAIKKLTCCEVPVPSQVVLSRTLNKNLMSVATKIALQLNCKLGGDIWNVEIPLKSLMIVGIDTYHDSAKKGRSVGATVASTNVLCTRYYSRVTFQESHTELISGLEVNLIASLRKYNEVNHSLPEYVIIYRDGVGDGQLSAVYNHELPQIQKTFHQAGGTDYNPHLYMVVVKKRINTRLMMRGSGGLDNPPPGTCVDSVITKPEWYDFFLVSQSVRQGTVTPTHFNVIWAGHGGKLTPDHLQRLSYKLTHLYYNWPGTVRVPAPCQYAHKLAFLVGQSTHQEPHISLCDKLFFL